MKTQVDLNTKRKKRKKVHLPALFRLLYEYLHKSTLLWILSKQVCSSLCTKKSCEKGLVFDIFNVFATNALFIPPLIETAEHSMIALTVVVLRLSIVDFNKQDNWSKYNWEGKKCCFYFDSNPIHKARDASSASSSASAALQPDSFIAHRHQRSEMHSRHSSLSESE